MWQYCYIGNLNKLKPAGWTFQKLYANNYKSYRKNDIFMFVVTKMALEISNVKATDQVMLIDFIIENRNKPFDFWESDGLVGYPIPNYVIQEGKLITRRESLRNKSAYYKAFEKDENTPYLEDGFYIKYTLVQDIKSLMELGSLEVREVE